MGLLLGLDSWPRPTHANLPLRYGAVSQLLPLVQLLNTTVASLAIAVNSVLSACYKEVSPLTPISHQASHTASMRRSLCAPLPTWQCYGAVDDYEDDDECMLLTAALASTTEVEALYTAHLIDFESAIPAALHSLGATASEITDALTRKRELEEEKKKEAGVAAESASIDNAAKKAAVLLQEAQAEKTKAETTVTLNPPARPAAPGGDSS